MCILFVIRARLKLRWARIRGRVTGDGSIRIPPHPWSVCWICLQNGFTPLMVAVERKNIDILKLLTNEKANIEAVDNVSSTGSSEIGQVLNCM